MAKAYSKDSLLGRGLLGGFLFIALFWSTQRCTLACGSLWKSLRDCFAPLAVTKGKTLAVTKKKPSQWQGRESR